MTPARRAPVIMDIFLYVPGSDEPLTSSARITAEGLEFIGLPESIEYDLLRSDLAQDFTAASCITVDGTTSATDPATPASGDVFFYLVRATNSCGAGTLGLNSQGVERVGAGCL